MCLKHSVCIITAGLLLLLLGVASARAELAEAAGNTADVQLTPEERAFLSGKKVRLGVDSARPPFEYIDEKGVYSGISAGFMEACLKRLGVSMATVPGLNVSEAIKKITSGEIDIIPKVTPTSKRKEHLLFTNVYATFPSVIITRKDARFIGGLDDLDGLRIGVLKGLVVEELLYRDYPGLPLIAIADVRTALMDLSTGKIDAFIDNLGTVSYNIEKLGLTNLKIASPTPYNHDLAFGVRKDWPLLVSALNKALASMSNQEKTAVKGRWLSVQYQAGVNWKTVGPIGAAMLIVTAFVLIWNRRLRHAVSEREAFQQELKKYARELESRSAMETEASRISCALQKAVTFEELAYQLLSNIAPLSGAAYGMLYIFDKDTQLFKPAGGYGCMVRDRTYAIGQGLVGQCALEKAPITLSTHSGLDIRINWGMGEASPKAVILQPVMQQTGLVLGVLELSTLTEFIWDGQMLIDKLIPVIAMNIEILNRNLHTQNLLEATKLLADQLQSQQKLLQETEIWYQRIIESAPDGIMIVDKDGRIILTNVMADKAFGYEPGELTGETVEILVPDVLRAVHGCSRESFMETKVTRRMGSGIAVTGVRKNGSEFPAEIGLSPLPEEGVQGLCVCVSIRDITDARRAEDELRMSKDTAENTRQQMVDMSNSLPLAIFQLAVSPEGKRSYTFISSKVSEVLGVTAEQLYADISARWRHVHPEDLESTQETLTTLFQRAAQGETEVSGEIIYRVVLDGNIHWALSYACVKHMPDGTLLWNGFYQDITGRKQVEDELKRQMEDLERFSRLTIDRELRMIQLKEEINTLMELMNKDKKYKIVV